MKKFASEFKTFITRGNVVDLAVGVIIGGAFTAIVNGLSDYILKPLINALLFLILGKGSLENIYTFLHYETMVDEGGATVVDLANSIYIDWGAFISAIINFFIIAIVLFVIVKFINHMRENHDRIMDDILDDIPTKEDRKDMKAKGIKLKDRDAVKKYMEEKKARLEQEKIALEEKAKLDAEEAKKNSTEGLLLQIKELLEKNIESKKEPKKAPAKKKQQ
jgi:large conductance mechanosensitive channel